MGSPGPGDGWSAPSSVGDAQPVRTTCSGGFRPGGPEEPFGFPPAQAIVWRRVSVHLAPAA